MSRKKIFKLPYIGIEDSDDDCHFLQGMKAESSAIIKIQNPVLQYSADPEKYMAFHYSILQVIKIIGEGHIFQKLDIFSKEPYTTGMNSGEFLQRHYDEHFEGREHAVIYSYIVITVNGQRKLNSNENQKKQASLKEKVDKVIQVLDSSGFNPTLFQKKDIDTLVLQLLSMNFKQSNIALDNIKPDNTHISMGDYAVKCLSLIDIDRIDLPEEVSPYVERNDNEAIKGFPVDTMSFLYGTPDYDTIVYNQIIEIPKQVAEIQRLQIKRNRHNGIPDPENDLAVEDIQQMLEDVAKNNQHVVNSHFSILVKAEHKNLKKAVNSIENALFLQGIIPSKNSYNQLELFRAALPGNGVELQNYDKYLTTSDAALTFLFKEALPVSEPAPKGFSIRFTDRQGIPLSIDPADHSRDIGRINNRNKFVLGPSGSGKSFFMNALVEQYMLYNMDVVIVDTGDSYSGISSYFNGKYITWKDDKPITMNPFIINKQEYNLEKKDFLVTLIGLVWKGADGQLSQVESDVISNVVSSYYESYFNGKDEDWIYNAPIKELEEHLQNNGSDIAPLFEEAKASLLNNFSKYNWNNEDYYSVLGVNYGATADEIKSSHRKLAKKYHPDKNGESSDDIQFHRISIAYQVLSDPNQKKGYDLARNIDKVSLYDDGLNLDQSDSVELSNIYHGILKRETISMAKHFNVQSLSFNTFYDFSLFMIPRIIDKEEISFDFKTFRYVLRKFYRGGEFQSILNEQADSSLFDERFIVFEIDNIKEHKILFPIVTLIIMDVFIQKMRNRHQQRKTLIIEEAWKAIASPLMAGYILYLYKTVRKHNGEAIVVTQELDDIVGNAIVKDSIINNSDTICLLDQTKFKDNYDAVSALLSINQVEKRKIFTINNLDNKENRPIFKEFYMRRGAVGEVYGAEVSFFQYLTYTTEKPEKLAVETYVRNFGSYPNGLEHFSKDLKRSGLSTSAFFTFINLIGCPVNESAFSFLKAYQSKFGHLAVTTLGKHLAKKEIDISQITGGSNQSA